MPSAEITDETCIAIAMLHGAEFHQWKTENGWGCWHQGIDEDGVLDWRDVTADTQEEAARKYCERHNLLR